jgi:hypothetical protein
MFQFKNGTSYHARAETLVGKLYDPGPISATRIVTKHFGILERELEYRFYTHSHPYVGDLVQRLLEGSVKALQGADTEYDSSKTLASGEPRPVLYDEIFSATSYQPNSGATGVVKREPVQELDFDPNGPYAVYNWELFFHVPLTIAIHLSKNQRFEEAMRWFHYVFDPTDNTSGPTPERYWKVRPFRTTPVQMIEEILVNLAQPTDEELHRRTVDSIEAWKDHPFRPHVIARQRPSAYMFKAVFSYLDNLVAWGDSLFRQDTRESINEALQIYVIAANVLGPKPQAVPKKGSTGPQTYAALRGKWRELGSVLVDIESDIPFDIGPVPLGGATAEGARTLHSLGRTLYFCVPKNDKLISYWDTVADRLFKIRNSLNIRGIFRQLPLFEPPIDPALLARAAASGLDVAAVVSGASQPLSLVRFSLLLQKANEICQEVKSLGSHILSAMEKEDNEALAVLRARHEKSVLTLAEAVRYGQWQEAIKAREGVEKSIQNTAQRYIYYERLLGREEGQITLPTLDGLDGGALDKLKLTASEPDVTARRIDVDIAQGANAEGHVVSSHEKQEMEKLAAAQTAQDTAAALDAIAGVLRLLPEFGINILPFGCGGDVKYGGAAIAGALQIASGIARGVGARDSYEAGRAAKIGGYARREQDWAYQSNLAAGEITQLFRQLRAAQIREHVAEREWKNHQKQIENAQEVESFLTDETQGKKTNQGFYAWMKREAKGLHATCFDMAFEVARKAERALQHELGDPTASYIDGAYLAGREGLFAGEKLYLDLKRMELAYHELNQREYELTKHVSLLQFAPEALVALRATGKCQVVVPEEVFDLDGPGHYFRRIKTVSVSVPCIMGPYTSIGCKVVLLKSEVRRTAAVGDDGYASTGPEDSRFSTYYGGIQSIVTSSSQNDSGMFEANLRDERYLPFEGSGAISTWSIELPAEVPQFDLDTIADVVLHIRYTAREGGDLLRKQAVANTKKLLAEAKAAGSSRLFSVRHEFPGEWAKFKQVPISGATDYAELSFELLEEHYPFWSRGSIEQVHQLDLFAKSKKAVKVKAPEKAVKVKVPAGTVEDALGGQLGDLRVGRLSNVPLPTPTGKVTWLLSDNTMSDLFFVATWGKRRV